MVRIQKISKGDKSMNCPKCSAPLNEDAAFCPECGERVLLYAQKEKCADARKKKAAVLGTYLHGNLFLVYAILMSIIAVAELIRVCMSSSGKLFFAIPEIPVFVCSVVATVGAWILFAKKSTVSETNIGMVKCYMVVQFVYSIFTLFFSSIAALVLLVIGFSGAAILGVTNGDIDGALDSLVEKIDGSFEQSDKVIEYLEKARPYLSAGMMFLIIISLLIASILLVFAIFNLVVYAKSKGYWKTLKETARSGEYPTSVKAPSALLYVWGVLTFLCSSGAFSLGSDGFVLAMGGSALGGLLFVQGLLFHKIHVSELEAEKEIKAEEEKLAKMIETEATEDKPREIEQSKAEEPQADPDVQKQ